MMRRSPKDDRSVLNQPLTRVMTEATEARHQKEPLAVAPPRPGPSSFAAWQEG